jgi:hypothetical protein
MKRRCRMCKGKKARSFFSLAEWLRPDRGQGQPACCEYLRTKKHTGGGRAMWKRSNQALFV